MTKVKRPKKRYRLVVREVDGWLIILAAYRDGCYAVASSDDPYLRGPCAHSCVLAWRRYLRSGFIAPLSRGA